MNAQFSLIATMVCVVALGIAWWCYPEAETSNHSTETPRFIELSDNTSLDPLKSYRSGTVVLAFHGDDPDVEADLDEFLNRHELESATVVSIDVDQHRSLTRKYNVRQVPKYFVMQDGGIVPRDNATTNGYQRSGYQKQVSSPIDRRSRIRMVEE